MKGRSERYPDNLNSSCNISGATAYCIPKTWSSYLRDTFKEFGELEILFYSSEKINSRDFAFSLI